MIIFVFKFLFVVLCFNLPFIEMQEQSQETHTTVETIIIETTTEYVTIITDIPQSDVELAMNHDYGRYTTMLFNYINSQFDKQQENDTCYDDHMKCLISQAVATPVCAVNDPYYPKGFNTFDTYCDAYLDNCLRTMRYWRILDTGVCNFSYPGRIFDITPSRRYLGYQPQKLF